MMLRSVSLGFAGLVLLTGVASAQSVRDRQIAACQDDAMRLCGDYVPDEDRVKQCMIARRKELSAGCQAEFRIKR